MWPHQSFFFPLWMWSKFIFRLLQTHFWFHLSCVKIRIVSNGEKTLERKRNKQKFPSIAIVSFSCLTSFNHQKTQINFDPFGNDSLLIMTMRLIFASWFVCLFFFVFSPHDEFRFGKSALISLWSIFFYVSSNDYFLICKQINVVGFFAIAMNKISK